jgi:hypothetical protein
LAGAGIGPASAQDDELEAMATALKDTTFTLQDGLKAGERQGQPISAQFEMDDGKLQISIYTTKGDDFSEVVADPKTGAIVKTEKITDTDELNDAADHGEGEDLARSRGRCGREGEFRFPRGQHLSRSAGWPCDCRGHLVAGQHSKKGYGKAGLNYGDGRCDSAERKLLSIRMARKSLTLVRVGPVMSRSPSRANTE